MPLGGVLTRADTGEKSVLLLGLTERILIPQQAQELSKELVLGTETPLFRPCSKPEGTGSCPSSLQAANRVSLRNTAKWASLVAQWLRICLPMQGTRVRALVWEDPTCRGATKPVSHNY